MTPQEFAGKIRKKYPGAYDKLSDDDLTQKIIAKYPEYKSQVQMTAAAPATTSAQSPAVPGSFLERTGKRASGQIKGALVDLPEQVIKDVSAGKAFGKESQGPYSGVTGFLTAGPRAVYDIGKRMYQDYSSDLANLAGDIVTGGVLGGGERPTVKSATERSAEVGERAPKGKPAPAPVPEHLRLLNKEQRAKYQEQVTKAAQEHQQKLADHNAKQAAEKQITNATRDAQNNILSTHRAVRSALDDRWESMRNDMKGTVVSNPADIYNGVREAETEHLRGAPQSLQQFRNLVRELGIEDFVENEDGTLSAAQSDTAKPLDWETARVHYTAIGDRLAQGGLPGNVYQALKKVNGLLDSKLKDAAGGAGREQEYTALKNDWSDYMKDWKDTSAVSKGGSPLARVLQTPDAGYARVHLTGPAADRLLMTMEKYRGQGAQPELVGKVRNLHAASKLPRPKRVPVPKPAPKPLSPMTRGLIHAGGVGLGLGGGTVIGHPYIGMGVGRTLSEAAVRSIEKRRAAAAASNVPVDLVP